MTRIRMSVIGRRLTAVLLCLASLAVITLPLTAHARQEKSSALAGTNLLSA